MNILNSISLILLTALLVGTFNPTFVWARNIETTSRDYAAGILPSMRYLMQLIERAETPEEKNFAIQEIKIFAQLYRRWSNIDVKGIAAIDKMHSFVNDFYPYEKIDRTQGLALGYDLGQRSSWDQYATSLGKAMWNFNFPQLEEKIEALTTYVDFGFGSSWPAYPYENSRDVNSTFNNRLKRLKDLAQFIEEEAHRYPDIPLDRENIMFKTGIEFAIRYLGTTVFFRKIAYPYISFESGLFGTKRNLYAAGSPGELFARNLNAYLKRLFLAKTILENVDISVYPMPDIANHFNQLIRNIFALDLSKINKSRLFFSRPRQESEVQEIMLKIEALSVHVWKNVFTRLSPVKVIAKFEHRQHWPDFNDSSKFEPIAKKALEKRANFCRELFQL